MVRKIQWYIALAGINTQDDTQFETNGSAGQTRENLLYFPEGEYELSLRLRWEEQPFKNSVWSVPIPTNVDPVRNPPYWVETFREKEAREGEKLEVERVFVVKWLGFNLHPNSTTKYGQRMNFGTYGLGPISPEPLSLKLEATLDDKVMVKVVYWISRVAEEHRDPKRPAIFLSS